MRLHIARDIRSPRTSFRGLDADTTIHGITDGTWSFSDAIRELLVYAGPCDMVISAWTLGKTCMQAMDRFRRRGMFRTAQVLVDMTFFQRHIRDSTYHAELLRTFGVEHVRIWNSHAKFTILHRADRLNLIYLTSANLNVNRRVENFTIVPGGELVAVYLSLIHI